MTKEQEITLQLYDKIKARLPKMDLISFEIRWNGFVPSEYCFTNICVYNPYRKGWVETTPIDLCCVFGRLNMYFYDYGAEHDRDMAIEEMDDFIDMVVDFCDEYREYLKLASPDMTLEQRCELYRKVGIDITEYWFDNDLDEEE